MIKGHEKDNCEQLMKKIMEYDFMLVDLNLYLDTHAYDNKAIDKYNSTVEERNELVKEYQAKCGMLYQNSSTSKCPWEWVEDPWPWQKDRLNMEVTL